jgi:hypothetical protein
MKALTKTLFAIGFTSAVALTAAQSQPFPNETWSLDENGNGFLSGGSLVGFSNGTLQREPRSGQTTLYYNLGTGMNMAGDIALYELPSHATNDLLRFDGQGGVYFFSDREPGEPNPDLADVSLLPATQPGTLFLDEIGPEGNNGAFYTPAPGQPGFDTSGTFPGLTYHFISDVPEPAAPALFLFGAACWGFKVIRRKLRS